MADGLGPARAPAQAGGLREWDYLVPSPSCFLHVSLHLTRLLLASSKAGAAAFLSTGRGLGFLGGRRQVRPSPCPGLPRPQACTPWLRQGRGVNQGPHCVQPVGALEVLGI